MYKLFAAALALSSSALAAPTLQARDDYEVSGTFTLQVSNNPNLTDWKVVNAHIGAGTNAIELQRPTAYTGDEAVLNGTTTQSQQNKRVLQFKLNTTEGVPDYEMVLPIQTGTAKQVLSKPGAGSENFSFGENGLLQAAGTGSYGYADFYACPTDIEDLGEVFTLWFGLNVQSSGLPNADLAEAFVELGTEGLNHLVDKHWDKGYDTVQRRISRKKKNKPENRSAPADKGRDTNLKDPAPRPAESHGRGRKSRNELPPPEAERGFGGGGYGRQDSLERETQTTESVKNAYESERDDPIRPVDPALERRFNRGSGAMSYANGYVPYADSQASRPVRSQAPRDKYYDDDSDYDEREGRRYKAGGGRGYDDRDYDREVVETERYRGPARPYDARRLDSYGARSGPATEGPYGAGAVAPYRRSHNDLTQVSRRTSRSRKDRYSRGGYEDEDYDSRSRSRSGSNDEGWRSKVPDVFDPSLQGLGAALAGAAVGGLAGREFGNKHKQRDVVIGAIVGGLGANLAENKFKDWKEEREKKNERGEDRWESKYDRRSRSNMR